MMMTMMLLNTVAQLLYHRQYMYDTVQSHIDSWISYYFPKEPELAPPRPPIYVSDETREAIKKERAAAAAAAAEAESSEEDGADDDETELEGGSVTGDGSPPPAHDVGLDEPMEAAVPPVMTRGFPRRHLQLQQLQQVKLNQDRLSSAEDRIGALDNSATRVAVSPLRGNR